MKHVSSGFVLQGIESNCKEMYCDITVHFIAPKLELKKQQNIELINNQKVEDQSIRFEMYM